MIHFAHDLAGKVCDFPVSCFCHMNDPKQLFGVMILLGREFKK